MALDTVLVAVGDDDEGRVASLAQTTTDIAGAAGATVSLLHVFSEDQYHELRDQLEFDPSDEATPDTVARRHSSVRDLGDALDDAGVSFSRQGAVGGKGETVVDVAESIDADLIIVGGRKRSPAGKAVFGSTAQEIMLSAPCPVTFVRAD